MNSTARNSLAIRGEQTPALTELAHRRSAFRLSPTPAGEFKQGSLPALLSLVCIHVANVRVVAAANFQVSKQAVLPRCRGLAPNFDVQL